MKKTLLLVVSLFCITMAVNAQEASGSCKLPGSYDYVNADFYAGSIDRSGKASGTIKLSNQSALPITHAKVVVKARVSALELGQGEESRYEYEIELYNGTIYGIPAYGNKEETISYNINKGRAMNARVVEYRVRVENPICK